jgi:PEP-CTERM motif
MSFSLKALGAALLSVGLMGAAHAAATVIDFDEPGIALGNTITNQYAAIGLVFSGANHVVRNENDAPPGDPWAVNPPVAPVGSSPSFLLNDGGSTLEILVKAGFGIGGLTFSYIANNKPFSIVVLDANNTSYQLIGGSGSGNWVYDLTVAVGDNSRVRFNSAGNVNSDFAIDNIRFGSASSHGAPEPGAMALVAVALAGAAVSRRKQA